MEKKQKHTTMKKGCFYMFLLIATFISIPFIILFFLIGDLTLWGPASRTYDKKDLTDNYDRHEQKITELVQYFNSIVPKDVYVDIEITNLSEIAIFHVVKNGTNYGGWNIKKNSSEMKSALSKLGWNENQLRIVKEKLDEVNCISIDNGIPVRVGFQRSVMSKFSYVLFNESLADNDELQKKYNDRCMYIYYRDNVVLEYASGAIGSICFPKRFLEY